MDTEIRTIHTFKAGDLFDRHYRLLEHVGSGGFADVWRAKDELVDTIVALKIYTRLDKEGISELAKEYKEMRGIKHPNLLTGNHFDASGNIPYLEMDYCDGGSLYSKIGKMSNDELHHVLCDIAGGLACLHREGIVHQDIKPENILYDTGKDRYLLSDFGISSKSKTRLSKSVTMANMTLSMTEAYAPPEKFSGNLADIEPNTKGDIFSLGMTMFELAVGQLPFTPPMATGREMLFSEKRGVPLQLDYSQIKDSQLRKIVEGCTKYAPKDRPASDEILAMIGAKVTEPGQKKKTNGGRPRTVEINMKGGGKDHDNLELEHQKYDIEFQLGDLFNGQYRLQRQIDVTGFADIWKAVDELSNTTVALKIYQHHIEKEDVNVWAAKYKELCKIKHPNLHIGNHFGLCKDIPYLEMDYITDGNMGKSVGKTDNAELRHILRDICHGLSFLHKNGIVHQDVKPDNILYDTKNDQYILTDFDASDRNHSKSKKLAYTAVYAPPEKFSGNLTDIGPDIKGDIFSLGVTLYELSTGKLPVVYPKTIGLELHKSHGRRSFYLDNIADPQLRQIVQRCMSYRKEDRPTAEDVLAMLDGKAAEPKSRPTQPKSPDYEKPPTEKIKVNPGGQPGQNPPHPPKPPTQPINKNKLGNKIKNSGFESKKKKSIPRRIYEWFVVAWATDKKQFFKRVFSGLGVALWLGFVVLGIVRITQFVFDLFATESPKTESPKSEYTKINNRQTGDLIIRSFPFDIQVSINGVSKGETPLFLRDIAPGIYTITGKYEKKTYRHTVRVSAGKSETYIFNLNNENATKKTKVMKEVDPSQLTFEQRLSIDTL